MREEGIGGYIWFGTALRFLQDAEEGWPIHSEWGVAYNLGRFIDGLDELGLTVTANAARHEQLPVLLSELHEGENDGLTQLQATQLVTAMEAVRKTLEAEAGEKKAFVTSPKRWDADKLLREPEALLSPGVFEALGEHARTDFSSACRCLAFECSTAAAFHMMRGTEAALRDYYCSVVKRNRLDERRRLWGPMLEQLVERSKPPPTELMVALDHIRKHYRNPTQHPDAVYDIEQAQDLLGLCIPVVNQMSADRR